MGDEDIGARVRAALAYAGLDEAAAARLLGFSPRTLARVEANDRDLTIQEAKRLAEGTGVPLQFLLAGWDDGDRLQRAEQTVSDLAAQVTQILERGMAAQPPAVRPPSREASRAPSPEAPRRRAAQGGRRTT